MDMDMDRKDTVVDMHPSIPSHGNVVPIVSVVSVMSVVSVVSMQPTSHLPPMALSVSGLKCPGQPIDNPSTQ